MTRKKKSRSGGMIGVAKSDRPKRETNAEAQEARKRKRLKKRKGQTSGSRTQEGIKQKHKGSGQKRTQDSRLGSKKPIQLVVESAAIESQAAQTPVKKPQATERIAEVKVQAQSVLSFEQELDQIENDSRLNTLLERLDNDELLSQADQAYVDERVERHQFLLAELGYDEDDDFDDFDDEPDEAIMAQLDAQFVESQAENLSEEELYERFLKSEKAQENKEDN